MQIFHIKKKKKEIIYVNNAPNFICNLKKADILLYDKILNILKPKNPKAYVRDFLI